MQTALCFDFGNTRLKCAVFHDNELKEAIVLSDDNVTTIEDIIHQYKPQKAILSSVINHNPQIETVLQKTTDFHKLNADSKINFTTPVGKPETIGADRLAICAAAVDLFPNQHVLAIALGSCITYNYISKFHQFLGGSISPGMYMRFKAMHEQTALLPLVKPTHNFPLVGYDTATNLQSGVILGMSKEIDGIIELYNEQYNDLQVLLTGGDMEFFTPHLRNKLIADPYLLYKGLLALSKVN
ncbi:MAG: type III pantothenate kinase [Chitinophaga sp.]|jgi:type III pantothenate kinase|nr:type III pantothenate kinase [Chitinophaga sp.]